MPRGKKRINTGESMHDLFIVAGEASGDLLGDGILEALPPLKIAAIAGPKMRNHPLDLVFPMEELQVMGFVDVALALPHLFRCFRKTVDAILTMNPKMVLTIDYPGFNLRLARTLRKKNFRGKICHYICPSVWAWGKKRIGQMAAHFDLLLSVLPFEKPLFEKTPLPVEYIGHPLLQKLLPKKSSDPLIAFFPGSRIQEIERNLPYYLRLITTLQREFPSLRYVISVAHEKYRPLLEKKAPGADFLSPSELEKYSPLLAVAKSGTVALELALQEIPTVVTYPLSPLDLFLAKHLFKIAMPYYSLPNILTQDAVFPELIGPALTDGTLAHEVKNLITHPSAREACQKKCRHMRSLLGPQNASKRAAELILRLLKE